MSKIPYYEAGIKTGYAVSFTILYDVYFVRLYAEGLPDNVLHPKRRSKGNAEHNAGETFRETCITIQPNANAFYTLICNIIYDLNYDPICNLQSE